MSRRLLTNTLLALLLPTAALAQSSDDVTLSSDDGVVSISGKLLGFDDEFYKLESTLGVIEVPIALSTCKGAACPEIHPLNQEISIAGASFLLEPLLPSVLENYASDIEATSSLDGASVTLTNDEDETLARFDLKPAGPAASLDMLLNGEADMALLSRRITEDERAAFEAAGLGDLQTFERERIVAQEGLVVAVSPDTGIQALTLPDLSGIFSGQFRNWADFGGADLPIRVLAPARETGAADFFFERVLDPEFGLFADDVEFVSDMSSIANEVLDGSGIIGVTSSTAMDPSGAIGLSSSCGLIVPPSDFTIKSEDYPLSRRMYLYTTNADAPSRMGKLVDFLESPGATEAIGKTGLTTFAVKESALSDQGNRLAHALANPRLSSELQNLVDFADETIDARRLSFTFRFAFGSSRLDNKALADIERLIQALNADELRDLDVLMIGFTDSVGDSGLNTTLSQQRAEQVLQDVITASAGRLDPERFRALGYGAASPVACNSSEAERRLNRRVEIWVR